LICLFVVFKFLLSLVQHSSFDNKNRKLGFAKLVVHAADLLTVDGLFLFKVVEALWEGTYYQGLCMPEKKVVDKMVVDKMVVI
jgi:hypothetical protein